MPTGQPQPELKLHQECLHFYTCEPFVLSLLLPLPWHFLSPAPGFLLPVPLSFPASLQTFFTFQVLLPDPPEPPQEWGCVGQATGSLCRGEGGGGAHTHLTLQFVSQTGMLRHSSNSEANGYPLRLEWV